MGVNLAHDMYLPARRAPREVQPRGMGQAKAGSPSGSTEQKQTWMRERQMRVHPRSLREQLLVARIDELYVRVKALEALVTQIL